MLIWKQKRQTDRRQGKRADAKTSGHRRKDKETVKRKGRQTDGMTSKQIDGKTSRQILKAADAIKYKPTHKRKPHEKKNRQRDFNRGKKDKDTNEGKKHSENKQDGNIS